MIRDVPEAPHQGILGDIGGPSAEALRSAQKSAFSLCPFLVARSLSVYASGSGALAPASRCGAFRSYNVFEIPELLATSAIGLPAVTTSVNSVPPELGRELDRPTRLGTPSAGHRPQSGGHRDDSSTSSGPSLCASLMAGRPPVPLAHEDQRSAERQACECRGDGQAACQQAHWCPASGCCLPHVPPLMPHDGAPRGEGSRLVLGCVQCRQPFGDRCPT
jgi:hypothetical protein